MPDCRRHKDSMLIAILISASELRQLTRISYTVKLLHNIKCLKNSTLWSNTRYLKKNEMKINKLTKKQTLYRYIKESVNQKLYLTTVKSTVLNVGYINSL